MHVDISKKCEKLKTGWRWKLMTECSIMKYVFTDVW